MASEKYTSIKGLEDDALRDEIFAAETELQRMKIQNSVTGLENPLVIKGVRRDIARLKTEIRARELAAITPEQLAKRTKIRARRRLNK